MFRSIKIHGLFDTTDFVLSPSEHSGNINKSPCQDTEEIGFYLVLSHEKLKLHSLYNWKYLFLVCIMKFSLFDVLNILLF